MPRPRRPDYGGQVVHVVNRAARRVTLFRSEEDYAAFECVLLEALACYPVEILAFCVMPNHWHLVLVAESAERLRRFLHWLTGTHAMRWQLHRGTCGGGAVYQGRYRAFAIGTDEYLFVACRYVERNALRANLVTAAEDWRWGSLWHRENGNPRGLLAADRLPRRSDWLEWVNSPHSAAELEALRRCVRTELPFGPDDWARRAAERWGLASRLRGRGRPRKEGPDTRT